MKWPEQICYTHVIRFYLSDPLCPLLERCHNISNLTWRSWDMDVPYLSHILLTQEMGLWNPCQWSTMASLALAASAAFQLAIGWAPLPADMLRRSCRIPSLSWPFLATSSTFSGTPPSSGSHSGLTAHELSSPALLLAVFLEAHTWLPEPSCP